MPSLNLSKWVIKQLKIGTSGFSTELQNETDIYFNIEYKIQFSHMKLVAMKMPLLYYF